MKFGKLADISNVDFSLPPDPEGTKMILDHLEKRIDPPTVYIGATGWGMKEWNDKWYPKKTNAKGFLLAYGKQFNTIELNTTHYRIPTIELTTKWYKETPDDFVFCPKIPQTISHSIDLGISTERVEIFSREIKELKDKLGCCFMQMPPYFKYERLHFLERFLSEWDTEIPLAIELRNEDWFIHKNQKNELFKLLEKYNISTVITDVAGRRDVLHNRLTSDIAMIRFVGNGLHETDYSRINEWVQKLKYWFSKNLKTVYFFSHQPDNILSPEMAVYLTEQLKAIIPNIIVRGPKEIEQQMMLF
jgi:uncharacterized protein YecE (DUF72 family)